MTQRPDRVFRGRTLTPEEVMREEELRRRLREEFPPARAAGRPDEDSRQKALERLRQTFAAAETHAQEHHIDDAEIDAAVDEALKKIRYGQSPRKPAQ